MSREVRWALVAVGSVLLLAGLILGLTPLEASYQLGGMLRPVATSCGTAFTGTGKVECADVVSSRLTLSIVLVVVGVAVLAAWAAVSLRPRDAGAA